MRESFSSLGDMTFSSRDQNSSTQKSVLSFARWKAQPQCPSNPAFPGLTYPIVLKAISFYGHFSPTQCFGTAVTQVRARGRGHGDCAHPPRGAAAKHLLRGAGHVLPQDRGRHSRPRPRAAHHRAHRRPPRAGSGSPRNAVPTDQCNYSVKVSVSGCEITRNSNYYYLRFKH